MTNQDDGLFLLEVLVEKVVFRSSPCFSDKDFSTCVSIQCPSVEPLVICDDDPGSLSAYGVGPFVKNFNSGKSCLFSLQQAQIATAMSEFPIQLEVYKSLQCGCLPTKITLGVATIDMTKEFIQARQKFLENPNVVSCEALKDTFRFVGPDKVESGEIVMFLRISCFGKLIITKFQGAGGPPKIGAGGQASGAMGQSCRPRKDFQTKDDPCVCGPNVAGKQSERLECWYTLNPGSDPYNSKPCEDLEDPCLCTGPRKIKNPPMECRNTDQYCLHLPKGHSKQYEEIGSNLGGNELRIKVPASSAVIKKISQTHCALQHPFVAKSKEGNPCNAPCGKNQISLCMPSEATCCRGARPQCTQFSCTTGGCAQQKLHASKLVAEKARGDGTQRSALVNKENYVLKVAKTAMQGDRKCKLELELVAPKAPDKIMPPRKQNMKVSTDGCLWRIPRLKTQNKSKASTRKCKNK